MNGECAVGERFIAWCTGLRVVQAFLLLAAGGGGLFLLGPYARLKEATGGAVFPEEEVTEPAVLLAFLGEIGESGRSLYSAIQIWDVVNVALIGGFALVLVGWVVGRSTEAPSRSWLLLIPLIGPLADLIENGIIAASIASFPAEASAATLLPAASTVKFSGLALVVFFCIILGGRGIIARRAG